MKTFHYYGGNVSETVLTVGELIDELARFPRDMPVFAEWEGQYMPLGGSMGIRPHGDADSGERCDCLIVDAELGPA